MKRPGKKLFLFSSLILLSVTLPGCLTGSAIMSFMWPEPDTKGAGRPIIACVGDSITYGYGVLGHREDAWPALLPALADGRCTTVNYGLCNRTLLSTSGMPYSKEKNARIFMEEDEDLVLLMLGTNDSKPSNWDAELFEKEYLELVDKILAKPCRPKVVLMLPPCLFNTTGKALPDRDNLENGVIPAIRRVAEKTGLPVIDLFELTKNRPDWFPDGIHPNREGNMAIAGRVALEISSFSYPDRPL